MDRWRGPRGRSAPLLGAALAAVAAASLISFAVIARNSFLPGPAGPRPTPIAAPAGRADPLRLLLPPPPPQTPPPTEPAVAVAVAATTTGLDTSGGVDVAGDLPRVVRETPQRRREASREGPRAKGERGGKIGFRDLTGDERFVAANERRPSSVGRGGRSERERARGPAKGRRHEGARGEGLGRPSSAGRGARSERERARGPANGRRHGHARGQGHGRSDGASAQRGPARPARRHAMPARASARHTGGAKHKGSHRGSGRAKGRGAKESDRGRP